MGETIAEDATIIDASSIYFPIYYSWWSSR
jgi:hypothetical protein